MSNIEAHTHHMFDYFSILIIYTVLFSILTKKEKENIDAVTQLPVTLDCSENINIISL